MHVMQCSPTDGNNVFLGFKILFSNSLKTQGPMVQHSPLFVSPCLFLHSASQISESLLIPLLQHFSPLLLLQMKLPDLKAKQQFTKNNDKKLTTATRTVALLPLI